MKRQMPPGRTSMRSTLVSCPSRPHQRGISSGSVIARNTVSRGASKTRLMTMSCRPGSMTNSASFTVVLLLFASDALDLSIQAVESAAGDRLVALDPLRGQLQRLPLQPAGPPLRLPAAGDQPGSFEHLEVLGDGLEADRERLGQLVDRRLAVGEAGEDRPTGRVRQRGEGEAELVSGRRIKPPGWSTNWLIIPSPPARVEPTASGGDRRAPRRGGTCASGPGTGVGVGP